MATIRRGLLFVGGTSPLKPVAQNDTVDGRGNATASLNVKILLASDRIQAASGHGDAANVSLPRKRAFTTATPLEGHGIATASLREDVQWASPVVFTAHGDATAALGKTKSSAVAATASAHGDATVSLTRNRRIRVDIATGNGDSINTVLGTRVSVAATASAHGDSTVTLTMKHAIVAAASAHGDAVGAANVIIALDGTRIQSASGHGDVPNVTLRLKRGITATASAHGDAVGIIQAGGSKILTVQLASGHGDANGALGRKKPLTIAAASAHGDATVALGKGHAYSLGVIPASAHGDTTSTLGVQNPLRGATATANGNATVTLAVSVALTPQVATAHGDSVAALRTVIGLNSNRIAAASGHGDTTVVILKNAQKAVGNATATAHGDTVAALRVSVAIFATITPTGIGVATAQVLVNGAAIQAWNAAWPNGYVTQFDPAWFHPATVHTYTVLMSYGGTGVRSRLRYKDVGADPAIEANWTYVNLSVVSTAGIQEIQEYESQAIPASQFGVGPKDYRAEVQRIDGSSSGVIYRARIAHKVS